MAITDYSSLQTAVGNWLHRSDLTSQIPDFISLAEAKLNRMLRIRAMENITTGTVAQSVSLPTGFVEMIALTVTTGGTTYPLTYIPPTQITSDTSTSYRYSLVGDKIYFVPVGSGESYTLTYYKKFDALSSGANWLITNAPDVYLYSALMEAAPYLGNDSKIGVWAELLKVSLEQLKVSDDGDRYGSSLVVRVA